MSSTYFRIEVYGEDNYGCPQFDLMGYNNINELIKDCWDYYHQTYEDIKKLETQDTDISTSGLRGESCSSTEGSNPLVSRPEVNNQDLKGCGKEHKVKSKYHRNYYFDCICFYDKNNLHWLCPKCRGKVKRDD